MTNLDNGIFQMEYDPKKVLSYDGETITNFIPAEGAWENEKFRVIKRTKRNIENPLFNISAVTGMSDRIYPGAILLANQRLMENTPTEVACDKVTLTCRVNNLLGLSAEESTMTIKNPTYSSVTGKIDEIAKYWLDNYSEKYSHTTLLEYKESMLYSQEQLKAEFGLESKKLSTKLNMNFSNNNQTYLCRIKQIFYSVAMDSPSLPSKLIDPEMTWEEMEKKGVNNSNPPVYISNVDFGRILYIKLETSSTSLKAKEAFSAVIKGIDISEKAELVDIIKESTFSLVVLGGSLQEVKGEGLSSIEAIRKIINSGIAFTPKNPGYPISYTTSFLKDHEIAVTSMRTDYVETNSEIFSSGEIKLAHKGAYVAKFHVDWEEINYDSTGLETVTNVEWKGNNQHVTSGYSTVIPLKANTRNINITAQGATGLVWEPWRTSVAKCHIPLIKSRLIEIKGTTLNQYSKITPDDDI